MRKALNAALVLAGVLVNVAALPREVASTSAPGSQLHRFDLINGVHVARPHDMKHFPAELLPLP